MQEISSVPATGGELAIAPAQPLAHAWTSAQNSKWTAAIAISCLLHAAVAAVFLISPAGTFDSGDVIQTEGSDQSGAHVAGSALDHESSAMKVTLVPDPQPAKPEAARPAQPRPPQPARQATAQAVQPLPEAAKQPAPPPDILVANIPRDNSQSVVAKAETPTQPTVEAESKGAPAVAVQPPIPSPRPSPPVAPAATSQADGKRGAADGENRSARAASTGKKRNEAGPAAESSYRSDVIRKLGRVNRGVPPSVQATARSNTVVTFVIGSRGTIDELRVVESSGSADFDQVVLGIVRKAAPFPPIPPKVGDSLVFTGAIGPF